MLRRGALACLGHADRKVRTMARPERLPARRLAPNAPGKQFCPMAGLQQKKCVKNKNKKPDKQTSDSFRLSEGSRSYGGPD